MQAFEEDWDTGGKHAPNRPTEFSLRPEHTPDDTPNCSLSELEKPDAHSSPSLTRRQVSTGGGGGGGDAMHNSHSHPNNKSSISSQSKASRQGSKDVKNQQKNIGQQVFKLVQTSVVTFLFICLFMSILLLVIIESESELFSHLKKLPELVLFRREYYEPLKRSIRQTFESNFKR